PRNTVDFYQIVRLNIFRHINSKLDSLQDDSTEQGLLKYRFPLAQIQGGTDVTNTFTINLIKKTFNMRSLILQVNTSCELPISQAVVPNNSHLPMENVFEDINDIINSLIKRNYNLVYEKIEQIDCSECDYKKIACFTWPIEKQWYITQSSNIHETEFVQFNTGFFWFITVVDINESSRYLKYLSDREEESRYNLGSAFASSHVDGHLKGPYKTNPTPIPPPEDDNNRQPTTTINTPLTTTINQPTTTINTPPTTTINQPTTTINTPPRPTNIPKILTTETLTTSKQTTSTTIIKLSSVKPTSIITTLSTSKINFISCLICKNEFKESKIKQHFKEYIKNSLSKDTVHDKLEIKKQAIVFEKMKELVSKLTDFQVKELIDKIQNLIKKYSEKFINYIPDEMKEQILYNFDK
ncbi:9682_t:CDS:2, partial [Racocetra persica]